MKATIKHAAAASKHGIMSTPNHPTYILLSVEVTHSQNCGQPASRPCCLPCFERVVILIRRLNRASRVEAIFISSNPSLLDRKTKYYSAYRSWLGALV